MSAVKKKLGGIFRSGSKRAQATIDQAQARDEELRRKHQQEVAEGRASSDFTTWMKSQGLMENKPTSGRSSPASSVTSGFSTSQQSSYTGGGPSPQRRHNNVGGLFGGSSNLRRPPAPQGSGPPSVASSHMSAGKQQQGPTTTQQQRPQQQCRPTTGVREGESVPLPPPPRIPNMENEDVLSEQSDVSSDECSSSSSGGASPPPQTHRPPPLTLPSHLPARTGVANGRQLGSSQQMVDIADSSSSSEASTTSSSSDSDYKYETSHRYRPPSPPVHRRHKRGRTCRTPQRIYRPPPPTIATSSSLEYAYGSPHQRRQDRLLVLPSDTAVVEDISDTRLVVGQPTTSSSMCRGLTTTSMSYCGAPAPTTQLPPEYGYGRRAPSTQQPPNNSVQQGPSTRRSSITSLTSSTGGGASRLYPYDMSNEQYREYYYSGTAFREWQHQYAEWYDTYYGEYDYEQPESRPSERMAAIIDQHDSEGEDGLAEDEVELEEEQWQLGLVPTVPEQQPAKPSTTTTRRSKPKRPLPKVAEPQYDNIEEEDFFEVTTAGPPREKKGKRGSKGHKKSNLKTTRLTGTNYSDQVVPASYTKSSPQQGFEGKPATKPKK